MSDGVKKNIMSDSWNEVKKKAIMLALTGISLFGGITKAQANNGNSDDAFFSKHKMEYSGSGFEHIGGDTLKYVNKKSSVHMNFSNGNDASTFMVEDYFRSYDMGGGYQIVLENGSITEWNSKGKYNSEEKDRLFYMVTPEGDTLDLSFYNTKDFMLGGHVDMYTGEEKLNSPEEIKANNDKWQEEMIGLAREIFGNENSGAVNAFSKFVEHEREKLELYGDNLGENGKPTIGFSEKGTERKSDYQEVTNSKKAAIKYLTSVVSAQIGR